MSKLVLFTKRLVKNDDGATAIEYGLLAALIAVAIITVVASLGSTLEGVFSRVDSQLVTEMPAG
jgi:pilus assembly protein Flp/PilA